MNTIRHHWVALILALLVGVVTSAPFILFEFNPGYQGISMMGTDAEGHYLARMQEVYDGFPSQGNVFLSKKNLPPIEPGLGEFLEAKSGQALHLSVSQVETYGKMFFPLVIALLIYTLAYTLSFSRSASVLAVLSVMFGDYFMSNPRAIFGLLHGSISHTGFLTYARPVSPEISAIFLFGTLILLVRLFFSNFNLSQGRRNIALIAAGVLTGLSLYISIYTFAFLGAFELLFFLCLLFRRKYHAAIEVGAVGALALLYSIPFVINYFNLTTHSAYTAASERFGLVLSHAPILGVLVLSIIIIAWLLPNRLKNARVFFFLAAGTLVLVLNQQILTGRVLQTAHFHWYITKPLMGIIGSIFLVVFFERFVHSRWVRIVAYGALCGVLLYGAILVQISSYRTAYPEAQKAQQYVTVLAYLNTLPSASSVWADRELSLYVPIYTHDDSPNNGYAEYYLIPQNYLVKRMLLEYRLRGVAPVDIRNVMRQERASISARLFGVYWRDSAGSYAAIPDTLLDTYVQAYVETYTQPLNTLFRELGVTEVVWDTKAQPEWNLGASLSEKPTRVGQFLIYRIGTYKKL